MHKIAIKFIYETPRQADQWYERVCSNICSVATKYLQLPDNIEIAWSKTNNAHGKLGLDSRFRGRIWLSDLLDLNGLIIVLIHELIHLDQITTKKLSCVSPGVIRWCGEDFRDFVEYDNLPWEIDVNDRLINTTLNILADAKFDLNSKIVYN